MSSISQLSEESISSTRNPRIKLLLALRERRQRNSSKLFLIEGYRELHRALVSKQKIDSLFFCPELFLGSNEDTMLIAAKAAGVRLFSVGRSAFEKVSYRDRPDGLIAIAQQQPLSLQQLQIEKKTPLYVIAEAIEKPGNLGTILRTCDGVAADGVIICDRCTDIYNPNVIRASVGTLFTLPVVEASSQEAYGWLKEHGIAIIAATPDAEVNYTDVDMTQAIAIAFGTEQHGLSTFWLERADAQASIAMRGVADSLNVAMATTIMLYESLRQRHAKESYG